MATQTFNSNAGGDGEVAADETTWSAVQGDSSGSIIDNTQDAFVVETVKFSPSDWAIYRSFIPFDTSNLGAGATITAADLYLYGYGGTKVNGDTTSICIVTTTEADPTALAKADYGKTTTTEVTNRFALSGWNDTLGAENHFTFTGGGLAQISKTSWTKLGILISNDVDNSAPTGQNYFATCSSDHTTAGYHPKLVVTYIASSASPSVSVSVSPSVSPSASISPSVSLSISPSASVSPSVSPSASPSVSPSVSPSMDIMSAKPRIFTENEDIKINQQI